MEELLKRLNNDLAADVMNRENARRMYQGDQKIDRLAYYTGRIEYITALMDAIRSNKL